MTLPQAYLIAGLFEESIKYLAVRRLVSKDYVVGETAVGLCLYYFLATTTTTTPLLQQQEQQQH